MAHAFLCPYAQVLVSALLLSGIVTEHAPAAEATYPPPAPPEDTSEFGVNFQRTMIRL